MDELGDLSEVEKQLLSEISQCEKELSSLIDENNSLESAALIQSYKFFNQDRPKLLKSVFSDIERSLYNSSTDSERNIDENIADMERQCEDLEKRIYQVRDDCNGKRERLLYIIRQLNETEDDTPPTDYQLDSKCSEEIESLAREFASLVGDVDEEKLILYLARGKSDVNIEEMSEKAKQLGEIRYKSRCAALVNQALEAANAKLNEIDSDRLPAIGEGSQELASLISELTAQLNEIEAVEENDDGEGDSAELAEQVRAAQADIEEVRQRLLTAVASESTIPMPSEINDAIAEKDALQQCIDSLTASAGTLLEYLGTLEAARAIDTEIRTEDDVRRIIERYEALKRKEAQ